MPTPIIKQVPTLWTALEQIRGLSAISAVWRQYAGNDFPALKNFLDASDDVAGSVPCSRCACDHEVITLPDHSLVGVCRCHEIGIHDLELTRADIILWRLNWQKLGRAICQAFGLASKYAKFGPTGTAQIGTWSADAVPAMLTIQWHANEFRHVAAALVARLHRPFILLAPTASHMDAQALEYLAAFDAEFFALDSRLILTPHGTFQPRSLPGEIFARFGPKPQTLPSRSVHPPGRPPEYGLRKGLGVWKLVFEGKEAELKHERGILYVAWLLANPPEQPIHALDLAAKIPEIYRHQLALNQIADPSTGRAAPVQSHARIQERSLSLDDAQSLRVLLRKEKELEAILDDENESEPVKQEALRELEAIAEFQRQRGRRSQDSAQRAVRAVRMAIVRFHRRLLTAIDRSGNPHPVLRPFAAHLEKHLLIPSARYCGPTGNRARGPLAGCFTYEPPPGVIWSD